MDRTAIVVGGGAEIVEFQDNGLAARHGGIARRGKPADPVVEWRGNDGVINVEVVIGGEVGIERDPEKAAFAGGIDREAHEWCAEQRAGFDHAHWPPCRQTKSRPSGANAIAVGEPDRLLPTCVSVNPGSNFAAVAGKDTRVSEVAIRRGRIDFKLERAM